MTTEPPVERRDDASEPDPTDLDEHLSAGLDGIETAVAGDVPVAGTDPETRRAQLAAARDLLAVPPPPLDELTRRRLVRTAAAAGPVRAPRELRRLTRLGTAVALLALVVGAGWGLHALGGGSSSSSKASSAAGSAALAPVDLHEVSNPSVLKRRVTAALRSAAPEMASRASQSAPVAAGPNVTGQTCIAAVKVPAGVTPEILGTATFHGRPAVVVVAIEQSADGPRTLVFVLATAGCRLLTSQFLRQ